MSQVQVLRELDGGWLQCQDSEGAFFYNKVTQQSSVEVPNDLRAQDQQQVAMAAPMAAQAAAPAAIPQVQVLRQLGGGWLQCQDAQGMYYYNQSTRQSSVQYPADLRAPALVQGAPANQASQARLKQQLGEWMICEDARGEFYMNARTQQSFDQPPAELVQLYRAYQQQKQ